MDLDRKYKKMPIKNITTEQKQRKLFFEKFSNKLNNKNKLYQLRSLINWELLEKESLSHVEIKQFGRNRNSHRVMLGLLMLQAMHSSSDSFTEAEFRENNYWQYFCGYEYFEQDPGVSEASIRRFRGVLGEEGFTVILQELVRIGMKVGSLKKKDMTSILVDTTVQIKNIKHPHDAHLMEKARKEIVKLCKIFDIKLNETYEKSFKNNIIAIWKYSKDSKAKKKWKSLKKLKTLLGRLIRIFEREMQKKAIFPVLQSARILSKIRMIHAQSVLKKQEKITYKENNKILYSFHAEEVECIGKGKLHKPYEFGNKVAIAVSGRGNFIVGVKSFHGNPYDGHTLNQTIQEVRKTTKGEPDLSFEKIFVDLGYKGNDFSEKSKIYTPKTKKNLSKEDKKMQKRRSAIEPIIGHLKNFGRMGRNYLKGKIGDIINPYISAIGLNLGNISNKLMLGT